MDNTFNEPKNVAGIAGLINVDGDDTIDVSSLEKDIISGAEIVDEKNFDPAAAFKEEMDKIQSSINKNLMSGEEVHEIDVPIGEESISTDTGYSYPMEEKKEGSQRWSSFNPTDPQLNTMTTEQKKQTHIQHVMEDIDTIEMEEIDKEREEDDKANLLEQISTLRSTLEDDGVDIKRIEEVDHESSMDQIKLIYKALRLKNDGNRYRSFAEELILAGAHGMEYLFDGEKIWFGKKPDLVGWSDTVKVKLRRMRYETTTFVKEIMQEYNISPGFRIALELIPSMFLYTRSRKITHNDSIVSDNQFKDAVSKLNSIQ